jgi:hypothetical protein
MDLNRRDFFHASLATSGLGALGLFTACGPAPAIAPDATLPVGEAIADQESYDFWTQQVRIPEEPASRGAARGASRRVAFVYYDARRGEFLTGSDIGDDGLADKGDADIVVNVDHIRPSTADRTRFENVEGGSLRIDLQQAAPLPSLAERLAWTAVAGFLPDNKSLPPLKEMRFDPGKTWGMLQTVPLPGGGGRWTWNFFLQRKQSRWMQVFDAVRRNSGALLPVLGLGLPAIAVTALNTVDTLVGELTKNERTDWLFQSPDVFLYATREAKDAFEGSKLRLKQGMYVVMPSEHLEAFAKEATSLTVKDGLIVPKNTPSLQVESVAPKVIPDVTYLTVGVTTRVKPKAL